MDEEIKKLVEKNLEVSEEILKIAKYVKSHIFWTRVYGTIKFLLIVVPLILGIIYLPPLLKDIFGQYQSVLTGAPLGSGQSADELLKKLPPDIRKLIDEKK